MTIIDVLFIALVGVQVVNPYGVRIRPSTAVSGSASVTESALANRAAQARKFVVANESTANATSGDVLIEWSPTTQQAWWTYQGVGSGGPEDLNSLASRFKVVFTPNQVAGFTISQPFLSIRALPGTRYESADAAQASALLELTQTGLDASTGVRGFKIINLATALPRGFFLPAGTAARGPDATITSASWQSGTWMLTIQSPNSQTARITLGSDFSLKSAQVDNAGKAQISTPGK